MKKLLPQNYRRALPVIQNGEIKTHLACVYTLTEGRQEGEIFVDNDWHPETVLVCPASGFWFLFGDAGNHCFSRFLPELLAEHLVDKCAVFATSEAWCQALDRLFAHRISRTGFEYQPSRQAGVSRWDDRVPDGFCLEWMTEDAGEKWSPGLDPWVINVWGGARQFVNQAFGFCMMFEERIVSIAAAAAIGDGEAEIEVGTVPQFRGRGLATLACQAFIEHCAANLLRVGWSCATGNLPSAALGRKLGFVEQEQLYGYSLDSSFTRVNGIWGAPTLPISDLRETA